MLNSYWCLWKSFKRILLIQSGSLREHLEFRIWYPCSSNIRSKWVPIFHLWCQVWWLQCNCWSSDILIRRSWSFHQIWRGWSSKHQKVWHEERRSWKWSFYNDFGKWFFQEQRNKIFERSLHFWCVWKTKNNFCNISYIKRSTTYLARIRHFLEKYLRSIFNKNVPMV